jgi:phosphatidylglycerophosphate synthase
MKHELRVITLLGYGILLSGFVFAGLAQNWLAAGQWLLQSGLVWGFVCHFCRQRLHLNRASSEASPYRNLGWGNRITLLRGGMIALTGGFLFPQSEAAYALWLPALCYTLAALLDRLDGYAARHTQQTSLLGTELDITFDALGLVIAPLLAISLGKIHASYLLLSMAYYLYQWALQHRQLQGLPLYPLADNPLRRTLAGFQMGFIALALWPLLNPEFTKIAGMAFMLPVLFGFSVDWLQVCGKLPLQISTDLEKFSENIFQPGLRLLSVLLLLAALPNPGFLDLSETGLETSQAIALVLSAGLMLFGFAGRLGALLLLMLLGWDGTPLQHNFMDNVLIFATVWLLLLGTGRYSLWHCGDAWLKRYDGA